MFCRPASLAYSKAPEVSSTTIAISVIGEVAAAANAILGVNLISKISYSP